MYPYSDELDPGHMQTSTSMDEHAVTSRGGSSWKVRIPI
jgi:hypothetical protein